MKWPLEDEIRWMEWRLRELEQGQPCSAPLTALDCRVWLAHKRDGKSYAEIARAEYPQYWDWREGKRGNQKIISSVRRVVGRIERYLANPSGDQSKRGDAILARVGLTGLGLPLIVEYKSRPRSLEPDNSPDDVLTDFKRRAE